MEDHDKTRFNEKIKCLEIDMAVAKEKIEFLVKNVDTIQKSSVKIEDSVNRLIIKNDSFINRIDLFSTNTDNKISEHLKDEKNIKREFARTTIGLILTLITYLVAFVYGYATLTTTVKNNAEKIEKTEKRLFLGTKLKEIPNLE